MLLEKDKLDNIILDMEVELNEKLKKYNPYSPLGKAIQAQLDILTELLAKIDDIV